MFVARVRGDRPPEFLYLSPSARVPLVVELTHEAANQLIKHRHKQSLTASCRGAQLHIWRSAHANTFYVSGKCGASAHSIAPHDASLLRRLRAQTKLAAHGQRLQEVFETWQAGSFDLWDEPLRASRSDVAVPPPSADLLQLFRPEAALKASRADVSDGQAFIKALKAEESAREAEKERREAQRRAEEEERRRREEEERRRREEEEQRRREELERQRQEAERQRLEAERQQREAEERAKEAARKREEAQKKAQEKALARKSPRRAPNSPRSPRAAAGFDAFAAPSKPAGDVNLFDMSSGGLGAAFQAPPAADAKAPAAAAAAAANAAPAGFSAFDAFGPSPSNGSPSLAPAMKPSNSSVFDAFSDMNLSAAQPTVAAPPTANAAFSAFPPPANQRSPVASPKAAQPDVFSAAFAQGPGSKPAPAKPGPPTFSAFPPPPETGSPRSAGFPAFDKPPSTSQMVGSLQVSEDVTATYSGTRMMQVQIEGSVAIQVTGGEPSPAPRTFQVRVLDSANNLQAPPMANPRVAQPVQGTPNAYRFMQPAGAPAHHPVLKYRVKTGAGPGAIRPVPIKVNRIVRNNATNDASQVSVQIIVNPSLGYPLDLHEVTLGIKDAGNRAIVAAKGSVVEGGRYNGSDAVVWMIRPPKSIAPGSKVVFTAQVKYNGAAAPGAAAPVGGPNMPRRTLGEAQVKLSATDRKLTSVQVALAQQDAGASQVRSQMKARVRYIHNLLPQA